MFDRDESKDDPIGNRSFVQRLEPDEAEEKSPNFMRSLPQGPTELDPRPRIYIRGRE
jgi:hypothetical protein